jgi:hypothetical protein
MSFQYFPLELGYNKRETQGTLSTDIGAGSKLFQTFIERSKESALLFQMNICILFYRTVLCCAAYITQ